MLGAQFGVFVAQLLASFPDELADTVAHLQGRNAGGVVDKQGTVLEALGGAGEPWPVVLGEGAGAYMGLVDLAQRREHSHDQLVGGHLQTEHQHREVLVQDSVLHQVHGKGGLAHGGTTGDDDHVGLLPTGGHLVQIGETRAEAGDVRIGVEKLVDAIDRLQEQVIDPLEPALLGTVLHDLGELAFGFGKQFAAVPAQGREPLLGNLAGGGDQLPDNGPLQDDLGIGLDIGGTGRIGGQLDEIGLATDFLAVADFLEGLGKRDDIERLALRRQLVHGLENQPVIVAVEITFIDDARDTVERLVGEHEPAEHGLLRLQ